MKLRGRTKTGIGLVLGILAGLGLVVLPGILAPQTQTPTTPRNGSNSTATSGFTTGTVSPTLQPKPGNQSSQSASATTTIGSVMTILSLTVLPALGLGFVVKRWASKQLA